MGFSTYSKSNEPISEAEINLKQNNANQGRLRTWVTNNFSHLTLGLIIILGAVLRFYRLDGAGLWLDEAGNYYWATYPLEHLFPDIGYNQAPLSYYIFHFQVAIFPWRGEVFLRSPSVFLGIGTIIACYYLGKELFNRRVGLATAVLAAICPTLINYSQEWRAYSLFAFLSACLGYYLVKAVRTNKPALWFGVCFFAILNLYTHHDALFTITACGGYTIIYLAYDTYQQFRSHQSWTKIWEFQSPKFVYPLLALMVILAGYIPGMAILIGWFNSGQGVSLSDRAVPFTLDSVGDTFSRLGLGWGPAYITMVGLTLLGFGWALRQFRATFLFCGLWLGIPFIAIALTKGGNALLVSDRYLIFLVPVYLVIAAAGCVALVNLIRLGLIRLQFKKVTQNPRFVTGLLGITLLILLGLTIPALQLYYANPKNYSKLSIDVDIRGAYNFILNDLQPDDVVFTFTSSSPGSGDPGWFASYNWYYMRNRPPTVSLLTALYIQYPPDYFKQALQSKGRLWTIIIDGTDTRHLAEKAGPTAKVGCTYKVCAIQQPNNPNTTMYAKFEHFIQVYGPDNPELTKAVQAGLAASQGK